MLLFAYWGWLITPLIPFFFPAYGAFLLLTFIRIRMLRGEALPASLRERLYRYLDDFYGEWLPLVFLLALALSSPWLAGVLLVHLLLFKNGIVRSWHDLRANWRRLIPG